ncbi:dynein light chain binding protein [Aureococcus anophagefferens]|nr:dynein light chain binding protein [Aureococcus anophagefferens]
MRNVEADPKLFGLVDPHVHRDIRRTLETMLDQLDRCQKALSDFLEEKRSAPRFYFIGDDDLLEILGQAKNPAVIQSHLKKLFQGVSRVVFDDAKTTITAMVSASGEVVARVVDLETGVATSDRVEEWLATFTDEMKATLASLLANYLAAALCANQIFNPTSMRAGEADFEAYPSQVLCVGELVRFADSVEAGLDGGLGDMAARARAQLETYTGQDLSGMPVTQLKVKALVMDLVHNMDVLDQLDRARCRDAHDWAWHKQLRYYVGAAGGAEVRMSDGSFRYTYEYQGNAGKLVHTPLTDKCYLTLTQGMHMGFGGNPYGPAGTGKTESVKAPQRSAARSSSSTATRAPTRVDAPSSTRLERERRRTRPTGPSGSASRARREAARRRTAARSDADATEPESPRARPRRRGPPAASRAGIDFQSMGRIFIGLKCGAWGCFDEFNRLKEDQLSAISQQIQLIQDAIKGHIPVLRLLGRDVDVDFDAGIFVTLNPAGKDYGGRSQIPDNLKALFRPVAMGRPDNELIAQVYLQAEGFTRARDLAVKVVSLFALSRQLLTPQRHYDWGLRALKAVLNTGGKLVLDARGAGGGLPPAAEGELLIKAVRVNTLAKLTFGDTARFLALIGDVFPGVASGDVAGGALEVAIRDVMASDAFRLTVDEAQVRKMLQLKEALDQRMGCVVVGPSGCGKSTVWRARRRGNRPPRPASRPTPRWRRRARRAPLAERATAGALSVADAVRRARRRRAGRPGPAQVLQAALAKCGTTVMNPKSMPRQQLLGEMDLDTREWSDGVLTDGARRRPRAGGAVVDRLRRRRRPEWIESLNSVLDDNHLLTLPNGERIAFGDNVNFLFETHDLRFASPATDADLRPRLEGWLDDLFYRALDYVVALGAFVVETTLVGTVLNGLGGVGGATSKLAFVAGLVRGLGGNLGVGDRTAFAKEVFLVTFRGFYDASLEFLRLEHVQIVASMNPATTVGRHPLSTRFTATVRVCVLDYPDTAELTAVYGLLEIALDAAARRRRRREPRALLKPGEREKLAATLVEVYERVKATFVVDDARHYLFTPRDLSAWVSNLLRYDLASEDLLNVVAYEGLRLFKDRMVDADAEAKLDGILGGVLRSRWRFVPALDGVHFTTLAAGAIGAKGGGGGGAAPLLRRVETAEFRAVVGKGVDYYERENAELRMLLFDRVLDHVARVDRVISRPGGNLLLIGRSGVGRRTAVRLVAYMRGYAFVGPTAVRADDDDAVKHFRSELKPALQTVAVEGQEAVFYVEDHHFAVGACLELVNSVLSAGAARAGRPAPGRAPERRRRLVRRAGEVPGLFGADELEGLFAQLREPMADEGTALSPYEFFVARVSGSTSASPWTRRTTRRALRVEPGALHALHDPVDGRVAPRHDARGARDDGRRPEAHPRRRRRRRRRRGRGRRAGAAAAERKGGEAKAARREGKSARGEGKGGEGKGRGGAAAPAPRGGGGGDAGGDVDDQLLEAIASMHESAAAASPREFVLFLENWRMLHDQMRGGIRTKLSHLSAGLAKLEEASATVDSLSNNAEVEQAKLVEAQKGADAAMEMITKTLSEATGRRGEVNDLKTEVTRREEHTISRQGEIKQELSSIQPVLETAKAAVGQIKAEHLNEIRSLKMPPEPIADVLGAVLKLLGISDVSWTSMKKFLGNRGVKDEILNYDARRIGGEMRKDVARLLKQKSTSFDQATITRVSVAAAPLAAWVKANIRYSVVLEKIQPLEAELARAEEDLAKCTLRLRQCEDEIATIDDRVAALKAEFGDKTREAEKLRARLALAEGTLDKAQHLPASSAASRRGGRRRPATSGPSSRACRASSSSPRASSRT